MSNHLAITTLTAAPSQVVTEAVAASRRTAAPATPSEPSRQPAFTTLEEYLKR